jgi:hypothetical protein
MKLHKRRPCSGQLQGHACTYVHIESHEENKSVNKTNEGEGERGSSRPFHSLPRTPDEALLHSSSCTTCLSVIIVVVMCIIPRPISSIQTRTYCHVYGPRHSSYLVVKA